MVTEKDLQRVAARSSDVIVCGGVGLLPTNF
jgi:hypothetical protein